MAVKGEVLFEFRRIGNMVKVTAFHVETLTEVTVAGPAATSQAQFQALAMQKLEYMLAKKAGQG